MAWDVLELGRSGAATFWGLGRFEAGIFWGWDVSGLGRFLGLWTFCGLGRFGVGTFCSWDLLYWVVL